VKSVEPSPTDLKRALRAELIASRARLTLEQRLDKSRAIAARLDELPRFRDARTVALYAPLGTEVDALEVARRLAPRGVRVVFPRSIPGERRLAFAWCDLEELVRGPLAVREPPAGAPAVDLAEVDCTVMPGVAFSLDGLRLGRGGGYYDATLEAMPRATRIGIAFDAQVVPSLPREPHDAPLDAVVTESRLLTFAREPG
jgi:5-formyltetrahydrofolate cyclo-ligase